jgi:hypothetical protein
MAATGEIRGCALPHSSGLRGVHMAKSMPLSVSFAVGPWKHPYVLAVLPTLRSMDTHIRDIQAISFQSAVCLCIAESEAA